MINEEISRDGLNKVKDTAFKYIIKPALRFVVTYTVKPTGKMLANALKGVLKYPINKLNPEHGKMSVKKLIRKDQGAQSMDIDGMGLGDFKRIANKYGVDFAIVKSTEQKPPKYSVFFKARDADAINAVVNEYTAKQLRISREGRTSILEKLRKFKDIVAQMPKKVVEKLKEPER